MSLYQVNNANVYLIVKYALEPLLMASSLKRPLVLSWRTVHKMAFVQTSLQRQRPLQRVRPQLSK